MKSPTIEEELKALRSVDFDWVVQLNDIWNPPKVDIPGIHQTLREDFASQLDLLEQDTGRHSPLGWVIVGTGGSGKTHLLGRFREECMARRIGFVFVDMTDVRDFWATVSQGYYLSLQQPYGDGRFQYQQLLEAFIQQQSPGEPLREALKHLATQPTNDLSIACKQILTIIRSQYGQEAIRHGDTVRALLALNSDDFSIASLGSAWLLGQEIEASDKASLGFQTSRQEPRKIVQGLSWLMSLNGPSVLALDQLDPIVTQLRLKHDDVANDSDPSRRQAQSIIDELGSGLCALRDDTCRTLTVVSCAERSWETLKTIALKPYLERFERPRPLGAIGGRANAEALVKERLSLAYAKHRFTPKYSSWPFKPEAFDTWTTNYPREILLKCDAHIKQCLKDGKVTELPSSGNVLPPPQPTNLKELDDRFEELRSSVDVEPLLEEKSADEKLGPLLQTGLHCAVLENEMPSNIDRLVDVSFVGGKTTQPLHARLRLVFADEEGREEHTCIRALQHTNSSAFQSRLKAAITHAGIDKALPFRRLVIVRSESIPGGVATGKLIYEFNSLGGLFLLPNEADLQALTALRVMKSEKYPNFVEWLTARTPASKTPLIRDAIPRLFELAAGKRAATKSDTTTERISTTSGTVDSTSKNGSNGDSRSQIQSVPSQGSNDLNKPPVSPPHDASNRPQPTSPPTSHISLGSRLISDKPADSIPLKLMELTKHAIAFAGSGSGKTVLLKRIIEEATIARIPSIIIDCNNDLAMLGMRPDARTDTLSVDEAGRAENFFREAETVVWTPGREGGNPLGLEPLPDLAALASDEDELNAAISMAVGALSPTIASGSATVKAKKTAILSNAFRFLSKHGTCNLQGLVGILEDFPSEATTNIRNEHKIANDMADDLKAQCVNNPLLQSRGPVLDPNILFGNATGRPIRGLLVIDEARNFVPSSKGSVCLASIQTLAAQARKYKLGLIFATQNPKDIDNKIVGQCSTQWIGKMSSPAAISAAKELLKSKGGGGDDVGRLKHGQFYAYNADTLRTPLKIHSPFCFSEHGSPLPGDRIAALATESRRLATEIDKSNLRTRISVINFIGLPTLEEQCQFINQLAMTLFAWVKRNPG
jgi:hypothetical protein